MWLDIFTTYALMGFEHISDIQGYDHMLFIVTLCCMYTIKSWKKVLVLVTAFTIGHSTTLALSALKIFIANSTLVEILIPVTILLTAITNIYYSRRDRDLKTTDQNNYSYFMALIFGFIHGLGFSNFFNAMMSDSMDIVFPLFAFNIGLELGQFLVVLIFFGIYFLINAIKEVNQKAWAVITSVVASLVSITLILDRF